VKLNDDLGPLGGYSGEVLTLVRLRVVFDDPQFGPS
jgi:hypothetical protein